jgi:enoyl-CoA hydratase
VSICVPTSGIFRDSRAGLYSRPTIFGLHVIDTPCLTLERRDSLAMLTLNRPEKRNAINQVLADALRTSIASLAGDPMVLAIILTGAGSSFCSGIDRAERDVSRPSRLRVGERGFFAHPRKPVIAAVNGHAVAGGLELLLNCDFAIASERASFADGHARVGAMPGQGLTVRLGRVVGLARAKEMTYTGQLVDAETALAWGLVNHVVPHDQLLDDACRIGASAARTDQVIVQYTIQTHERSMAMSLRRAWMYEKRRQKAWRDKSRS